MTRFLICFILVAGIVWPQDFPEPISVDDFLAPGGAVKTIERELIRASGRGVRNVELVVFFCRDRPDVYEAAVVFRELDLDAVDSTADPFLQGAKFKYKIARKSSWSEIEYSDGVFPEMEMLKRFAYDSRVNSQTPNLLQIGRSGDAHYCYVFVRMERLVGFRLVNPQDDTESAKVFKKLAKFVKSD